MSWFTEIAGKAEDLLNKVDKTTATVLQNKTTRGSSNGLPLKTNFVDLEANSFQGTVTTNSKQFSLPSQPVNRLNSSSLSRSSQAHLASKKKAVSDDEKLMEFLNSNEPEHYVEAKRSPKLKGNNHEASYKKVKMQSFPVVSDSSMGKRLESVKEAAEEDTEEKDGKTQVQMGPSIKQNVIIDFSVQNKPESEHLDSVKEEETTQTSIESKKENESSEMSSFQQELFQAKQRAKHSEAEMRRMQKKLEHWNSQISGNDKQVRELLDRERDMIARLDAKDSQLAVLKVRLEEADEEIRYKKALLEELKAENERLSQSYNDEMLLNKKTIDSLREQLLQTEMELNKSREAYNSSQTEHLLRMSKMEEEQRQLAESVTNLQRKLSEFNERNKESASRLQSANHNLESLQQEYADYKQKAQRILQSKEALISSLKKGCLETDKSSTCSEVACAALNAETEAIKQERDLLVEELRKANQLMEFRQNEIQELEKMAQNDSDTSREHCRNLEEQLHQERLLREEVQLLNNQLKEEMLLLKEELVKTKNNFQSRLQDREFEIEKLRKQLVTKSLSTVSQDELESRLHALTENLIQKQTVVEALSTEKTSLVLQLERLEQQLKEMQVDGSQLHSVIGVPNSESDRKQKPPLFLENPFDSTLTRKVKRVYGSIDAFSIRLGVFFRRYPVARLFIFVYMLILHLWVMIVLLTYEPEVHSPEYKYKAASEG